MSKGLPHDASNGCQAGGVAGEGAVESPAATSSGPPRRSRLVFLGTGVSTAIPSLAHLLEVEGQPCSVCRLACDPNSRNRRNNVSLLIRYAAPAAEELSNIIVDVGKTFRDAAVQHLVPLGVSALHAILLTHDHADAMGGMDDSRDLQPFHRSVDNQFMAKRKLPTYMTAQAFKVFQSSFPYIVEASKVEGWLPRRVAQLDFRLLPADPTQPPHSFEVEGLEVTALPVFHGGDYVCLGFAFGAATRVLYLSDVSKVPDATQSYLATQRFDLLVLDCLHSAGRTHFSHFCLDDAWAFTVQLRPRRAYYVGMFCDQEHDATNALLAERLKALADPRIESVQLAYDGLSLEVDL
eukprot:EG_transcript_13351